MTKLQLLDKIKDAHDWAEIQIGKPGLYPVDVISVDIEAAESNPDRQYIVLWPQKLVTKRKA